MFFLRLGSSDGMQGSLQLFALGLHSCALCFERYGTLWERFLEAGGSLLLHLGLWRAPGRPSGPYLERKNTKGRNKSET